MYLKTSSAKWRSFYLGLNVLSVIYGAQMEQKTGIIEATFAKAFSWIEIVVYWW